MIKKVVVVRNCSQLRSSPKAKMSKGPASSHLSYHLVYKSIEGYAILLGRKLEVREIHKVVVAKVTPHG